MKSFTISAIQCFSGRIKSRTLLTVICLSSALLFADKTFSQATLNCPDARRCTSKDLEVVGARIEGADECNTCTGTNPQPRKVYLYINNKTGSIRTSFALFGYLFVNGQQSEIVRLCGGPIPANTFNYEIEVGTINYKCGDQLTLRDNFLAWTDASDGSKNSCDAIKADNCKSIAPKCGTAANIVIRTPLSAKVITVTKPCKGATTGGSIKVTPSGGTAPYTVVVAKKGAGNCAASPVQTDIVATHSNVTADGVTTAATLGDGSYCIYVTDSKQPTACTILLTYTIENKVCCTPPPAPTVCQIPADLCGDGKVALKVSGTVKDAVYHVFQNGKEVSGSPKTASSDNQVLEFKVVPGGGNIEVYGETKGDDPEPCKGASTKSNCPTTNIGICTVNGAAANTASTASTPTIEAEIPLPKKPSVIAAPNPFNDRIRFTLKSAVSGQGSLELYNTMGQQIKVLYQGRVEAGQTQNLEYTIPVAQRSSLIYVFRVGTEQTSGKLIKQ